MTLAPDRRAHLVAEAGRTIQAGSRSFHMASRLFDRETRERAWLLYTWCRHCDDLADGQVLGRPGEAVADPAARLAYIEGETARALAGEPVEALPFQALAVVAAECRIPERFIADHIAGFAMDADGWRPADADDLLLYCYRVAGAVGCMMAVVMGVDPEDEAVLDRAADLGIAFQLGNIARDVGEDAAIGRCYLPLDWLRAAGIPRARMMEPDHRRHLPTLIGRLASLAARYEASGRSGAFALPPRARWAVLAAANIYGAIARRADAAGLLALTRRVTTSRWEKAGFALAAWREARGAAPLPYPRDGLWTRPRQSS